MPRLQAKLLKEFTKLDAHTLKLLAGACKAERIARALDLATQLQLPKSLSGALKLANHYRHGQLAERIARLMESRFEGGSDDDADDDVEQAPPPPAAIFQSAKPAAAAPSADADADDEDADDGPDESENAGGNDGGARPPVNPFAKGAAGKAALSSTVKGPKRTLPVTAAVGTKKFKK